MVGFHVVDDEVVDRPVADDAVYLSQEPLEEADVDGIYQCDDIVNDEV
jgi:hypothetical protein